MTNLKLNIIVDVLAFLSLAVVFISTQIRGGQEVHETAGWIFLVLIIVHLVLHRRYIKNLPSLLRLK